MSDKNDEHVKVLMDRLRRDGASVASVSDGYVICLSRKLLLEKLADRDSDEPLIIFVKSEDSIKHIGNA